MNNERQFQVVLLTVLLQHVVPSLGNPFLLPTTTTINHKKTPPSPQHHHIAKMGSTSSHSSWPPKLPSYDIWGSGAVIKKKSKISKEIPSLLSASSSSSPSSSSSSSLSQIITENDVDEDGTGSSRNNVANAEHGKMSWKRNGRVLNFFPVSMDDECLSLDGRRYGICLNAYECRIQGGTSSGKCALGFGVCCIFTATCDQEVFNNITYVISPSFPALMSGDLKSCKLKIKMIDPNISQLRFDFQHFLLGQPNRRTGICDGDFLMLRGGSSQDFMLCGQNSGQHLYYDVSQKSLEDGVEMIINLANEFFATRLWEIRVSQILFEHRAPTGCMQYYLGLSGVIQTFNFAENGRHLANQHYRACIRQETGMCSIAYEPCNNRSFRIGLPNFTNSLDQGTLPGSFNLPGFGGPSFANGNPLPSLVGNLANNPVGLGNTGVLSTPLSGAMLGDIPTVPVQDAVQPAALADEPLTSASEPEAVVSEPEATPDAQADPIEGSGGEDDGFFSGFRFPSLFSRRSVEDNSRKPRLLSGEIQDEAFVSRQSQLFYPSCTDRITLPCIIEDFIGAGTGNFPGCEPIHCGSTLCSSGQSPCRIETSVTPFSLGIHFGDGVDKGSPEDNIGACLRFNQVGCL